MEKILYTRCSPWIDLLNGGKVIRNEGFGVSAISPNLFTANASVNFRLVKRVIEDRKGDMNQFEKIYEYLHVGGDNYAFICSGELPLCTEPRKNGSTHRPIFMAEALIGKFAHNPAVLMNPENFKGDAVSQNDYYRLDLGPDTEPLSLEPVEEGALLEGNNFVPLVPARQKGLADLLAYVIEELAKPESQRTVLFIKDDNKSVIAYVESIARLLPAKLAKEFTFITHTSSYKSNPERYSYYNIAQSGEVMEYNPYGDESLKASRKCKYLVVGFTQGQPQRNMRSEFHLYDGKTYTGTFEVEPGAFLSALASGDPNAKRCLAYINANLNGEMPANRDDFYQFFRTMLNEHARVGLADLENGIAYYQRGPLADNPVIKDAIVARIEASYAQFAAEDSESGLRLFAAATSLEPSLKGKLMPYIAGGLIDGFRAIETNPGLVGRFRALESTGILEMIDDQLVGMVNQDTLARLAKGQGNDELLDFYFAYFNKAVSKGKLKIAADLPTAHMLASLLKRFADKQPKLAIVDMYLRPLGVLRDQTYTTAITQLIAEKKENPAELLLNAYAGQASFAEKEVILAKMLKNSNVGYDFFEKKYVAAYTFSKAKYPEYLAALIALFEVFPEEKGKGKAGALFGEKLVASLSGSSPESDINQALDYLVQFKEIHGAPFASMVDAISKLLMKCVLNGNSFRTLGPKLEALGIGGSDRLDSFKKEMLVAQKPGDQQKLLEEFGKEGGLFVSPDELRLPYFRELIKNLHFEKSMIHAAFWRVFADKKDYDRFIPVYLELFLELQPKMDGFLFYHSLCLILAYETESEHYLKMKKVLDDYLKRDDNAVFAFCYDKKFEKRLGELSETSDLLKNAKARLVEDYSQYQQAHLGFFQRLFGGKKK